MLEALVSGADDPQALAELAKGKLRQKRPELAEALPRPYSTARTYAVRI